MAILYVFWRVFGFVWEGLEGNSVCKCCVALGADERGLTGRVSMELLGDAFLYVYSFIYELFIAL